VRTYVESSGYVTHCPMLSSNGIGRDWPIMFGLGEGLVGTLEPIFYCFSMFVW